MKTFDELTDDQKFHAVSVAYEEIRENFRLGLIKIEGKGPSVTGDDFFLLATMAAEGSQYDDNGNPITEEIEVPYYFQGGCV